MSAVYDIFTELEDGGVLALVIAAAVVATIEEFREDDSFALNAFLTRFQELGEELAAELDRRLDI